MPQPPSFEVTSKPPNHEHLRIVMDSLFNLDEPYQSIFEEIFRDHLVRFCQAPGSRNNHQAWPGGYIEHIGETIKVGRHMLAYAPERTKPFTESDFLLIMLLHDIEKPFAYNFDDGGNIIINPELKDKEAKEAFRNDFIERYKIPLTTEHLEALEYVERVPHEKHRSDQRVPGPLAALCHIVDIHSARVDYDYPKRE